MTTPSGLPNSALQWWGVATGAAAQRASTADTWAAIKNAAAANGLDSPGLSLRDFNTLRSHAVADRNASAAFAKGNPESGLDGSMISNPPWARALSDQNALPITQVRFLHTTSDLEGNETSAYRTITFTAGIPATKQGLLDAIDEDSEALADKYNSTHVAVSNITVMNV